MISSTGVWSELNIITSECMDEVQYGSHVYKVQYLDSFDDSIPLLYTHVIPIPNLTAIEKLQIQRTTSSKGTNDPILKCITGLGDLCFYHAYKKEWYPIYLTKQGEYDVEEEEEMESNSDSNYEYIGSIVNIEYLPEMQRFRLHIRVTMSNIDNLSNLVNIANGERGDKMQYISNNYTDYLYTNINNIKNQPNSGNIIGTSGSGGDLLVVEVGQTVLPYTYNSIIDNVGIDLIDFDIGTMHGYTIHTLTVDSISTIYSSSIKSSGVVKESGSMVAEEYVHIYNKQLFNIYSKPSTTTTTTAAKSKSTAVSNTHGKYISTTHIHDIDGLDGVADISIGDYVWIWINDGRRYRDIFTKCIDIIQVTHEYSAFLSIINKKYIFSYSVTDRRDIMERSILDMELNRFVIDIDVTPRSKGILDTSRLESYFTSMRDNYSTTPVSLLSMHNFNNIGTQEKRYGSHLSSCYFYHGGVPIPQQLIYAAELVCVLVGAKPISMVSTIKFFT